MAKSENSSEESSKNGKKPTPAPVSGTTVFLRIAVKIFILAFLSAYTAAAILSHCPADLSQIKGYTATGETGEFDTDAFVQKLADAVATRLETISLGEEEVNAYIAATLAAQQTGYTGRYVTFRGVWVDFSKNRCRIYMERELFDRRSTMAIELKISREGDQFLTEFTGGEFGRLEVTQGFLLLVKHAYDRLATQVFADELNLIFQMNQIQFNEDQLILDPRFPKPANS